MIYRLYIFLGILVTGCQFGLTPEEQGTQVEQNENIAATSDCQLNQAFANKNLDLRVRELMPIAQPIALNEDLKKSLPPMVVLAAMAPHEYSQAGSVERTNFSSVDCAH